MKWGVLEMASPDYSSYGFMQVPDHDRFEFHVSPWRRMVWGVAAGLFDDDGELLTDDEGVALTVDSEDI